MFAKSKKCKHKTNLLTSPEGRNAFGRLGLRHTPDRNETMCATTKKMIDYHVMEYIWHDRRNNAQMRDHHMRQAVVVFNYCTRKQFEKLVAKAQKVPA
jgi:hypothetical protein